MEHEPNNCLVLAVSGGVDSMVMLHRYAQLPGSYVVAHVRHGIRSDDDIDQQLVRSEADRLGLRFETVTLNLAASASEDAARRARYQWLERVRESYGAVAIATAHHQDDLIETACINLMRGTGWRGLCSLRETKRRMRPLLGWSKAEIISYAIDNNIQWREDETNDDGRYLRNRIRHHMQTTMSSSTRAEILQLISQQCTVRDRVTNEADALPGDWFEGGCLRYPLIMLDWSTASEVLKHYVGSATMQADVRRALLFAKTAKAGDRLSFGHNRFLTATRDRLIVETTPG